MLIRFRRILGPCTWHTTVIAGVLSALIAWPAVAQTTRRDLPPAATRISPIGVTRQIHTDDRWILQPTTPLLQIVAVTSITAVSGSPATQDEKPSHRVRHAFVGAGLGGLSGVAIGVGYGLHVDRSSAVHTFPATPVYAARGLGIGLVAGALLGAFFP